MSGIKNVITIILRGAVFLTILSVTILTLNNALKVRHDNGLPEEYYDYAKDTFDVVFLGTSVMMDAVQPMELYRDYGIVGYNLASGNQSMGMSYYLAKEVIEKDHPSLIVLDCSRSVRNEKDTYLPFMHYVTDCMPLLSRNRIRMITELRDRDEWKELMLPLIAYHSRWNDFERPSSHVGIRAAMYGGQGLVNTKSIDPFDEPSYVEDAMTDSARIYLEKLVGLCRETDTSLLLVSMPIPGQNRFFDQDGYNKRWSATQDVADFARKNDVEYMNYLADAEELGLDLNLETDCSDGEHLNRWEAEKLTRLLGRHLQEEYGLPDRRGEDGVYQQVSEDFARYPVKRMQSCLQYASSLHRITDAGSGRPRSAGGGCAGGLCAQRGDQSEEAERGERRPDAEVRHHGGPARLGGPRLARGHRRRKGRLPDSARGHRRQAGDRGGGCRRAPLQCDQRQAE